MPRPVSLASCSSARKLDMPANSRVLPLAGDIARQDNSVSHESSDVTRQVRSTRHPPNIRMRGNFQRRQLLGITPSFARQPDPALRTCETSLHHPTQVRAWRRTTAAARPRRTTPGPQIHFLLRWPTHEGSPGSPTSSPFRDFRPRGGCTESTESSENRRMWGGAIG